MEIKSLLESNVATQRAAASGRRRGGPQPLGRGAQGHGRHWGSSAWRCARQPGRSDGEATGRQSRPLSSKSRGAV